MIELIKISGIFCILIFVMIGTIFILKKINKFYFKNNSDQGIIKLKDSLYIDPKNRIILIECNGKDYLLITNNKTGQNEIITHA